MSVAIASQQHAPGTRQVRKKRHRTRHSLQHFALKDRNKIPRVPWSDDAGGGTDAALIGARIDTRFKELLAVHHRTTPPAPIASTASANTKSATDDKSKTEVKPKPRVYVIHRSDCQSHVLISLVCVWWGRYRVCSGGSGSGASATTPGSGDVILIASLKQLVTCETAVKQVEALKQIAKLRPPPVCSSSLAEGVALGLMDWLHFDFKRRLVTPVSVIQAIQAIATQDVIGAAMKQITDSMKRNPQPHHVPSRSPLLLGRADLTQTLLCCFLCLVPVNE